MAEDIEKARERRRRYRESHRDEIRERNSDYRDTNREDLRQRQRSYSDAHPEEVREQKRRYREAHREQIREYAREYQRKYYAANREEILQKKRGKDSPEYTEQRREYNRRYHSENREVLYQRSKRKVARDALISQLWLEQNGLCYLCEEPVEFDLAVLEHDHSCCPPMQFCRHCARGAAHQKCNTIVGLTGDDPDQLERIARNLRARSDELRKRRPVQVDFFALEGA